MSTAAAPHGEGACFSSMLEPVAGHVGPGFRAQFPQRSPARRSRVDEPWLSLEAEEDRIGQSDRSGEASSRPHSADPAAILMGVHAEQADATWHGSRTRGDDASPGDDTGTAATSGGSGG